jgi:hypothetical protein
VFPSSGGTYRVGPNRERTSLTETLFCKLKTVDKVQNYNSPLFYRCEPIDLVH